MKIAFFGTSNTSRIFLEHLLKTEKITCVVTSPDKPSGRGLSLRPSPVKEFAIKNKLEVLTPDNLNDSDFLSSLASFSSSLFIVVSYGKIIPEAVFEMPEHGCINVHFSLLPKYRGAAPIQRSLINGDKKTGVTIFFIDNGMDTGDILLRKETEISDDDDYFTLEKKLIAVGIESLTEALTLLKSGNYKRLKQTGTPTLAPAIKKSEGRIDWIKPAATLHNLIRGLVGWPVAFTVMPDSTLLKIFSARCVESADFSIRSSSIKKGECWSDSPLSRGVDAKQTGCVEVGQRGIPGEIISIVKNKGFVVRCGEGFLEVLEVQPESKRRMSAWDFLQSGKLKLGDVLKS